MLLRFAAIVVSLAIATAVVPGIRMTSPNASTDWAALVGVAVIFGLVNSAVKPLFKQGQSPIRMVLLGLALWVINALLLLLTSWVSSLAHIPWTVDGFVPALIGALLVAVVSFLVNALFGRRGEVHR